MVEKRNNKTPVSVNDDVNRDDDLAVRSRRDVLKRVAMTMPAILTLQSGAALARSSNLISASRPYAAKDAEGRMLCLDHGYVDGIYDGGKTADIGEPAYAHITAIKRHRYAVAPEGEYVGRGHVCKYGGIYSYQTRSGEWKQTDYVPHGMLVSAAAWGSFASNIDISEIG